MPDVPGRDDASSPPLPGAGVREDLVGTHGGPDGGRPALHDFSTNANACGPCPAVRDAVRRADATRYPDPRYTALRRKLAEFHGVDAGRVVVAASASEFISRITAAVARRGGGRVALPEHHYGDYARAARAWGLERVGPTGPNGPPGEGATTAALAWHCDPSSPMGEAEPSLAGGIAALAPGTAAVLDLAYEPLRLEGRLGLEAAGLDRVWQLWTPNKALGMTGVRAAYAIAPTHGPDLREDLQRLAPSWPVGAHGVALLEGWAEVSTQAWMADSRMALRTWKARQTSMLAEMGWSLRPGVANFFCATPDGGDLPARLAALRIDGVQVRDAASFGLPGQVRVAVLEPRAQEALRTAWISRASPVRAAAPASRSRRPA